MAKILNPNQPIGLSMGAMCIPLIVITGQGAGQEAKKVLWKNLEATAAKDLQTALRAMGGVDNQTEIAIGPIVPIEQAAASAREFMRRIVEDFKQTAAEAKAGQIGPVTETRVPTEEEMSIPK